MNDLTLHQPFSEFALLLLIVIGVRVLAASY